MAVFLNSTLVKFNCSVSLRRWRLQRASRLRGRVLDKSTFKPLQYLSIGAWLVARGRALGRVQGVAQQLAHAPGVVGQARRHGRRTLLVPRRRLLHLLTQRPDTPAEVV